MYRYIHHILSLWVQKPILFSRHDNSFFHVLELGVIRKPGIILQVVFIDPRLSWRHCTTVDGRNPAPVDMVNIPSFTWFYTSMVVVWDFFHQQYHFPTGPWFRSFCSTQIGCYMRYHGGLEAWFENSSCGKSWFEICPDLYFSWNFPKNHVFFAIWFFFLEFSIQEVLLFFQRIMAHWKMAGYLKCDVTIGDKHTHFFHWAEPWWWEEG